MLDLIGRRIDFNRRRAGPRLGEARGTEQGMVHPAESGPQASVFGYSESGVLWYLRLFPAIRVQ